MKKLILLPLLVLLIPLAMAGNEYGKLTSGYNLIITDFDVKVDGLSSRNLDYGEEISRIANPDSDVILQIEFKNNHTSLEMTDIEVVATIDDLDLEKDASKFDLSYGKDKNIEITFTIPSDAEDRDYEILVEAEGKLNSTVHRVEYILDLVVELPSEETMPSSTKSSLQESIDNLNTVVDELNKKTNYFEPYTQCTADLNACNGEKATKDTEIATFKDYKAKFENCDNEKTSLNTQINSLYIENKNLEINKTSITKDAQHEKNTRTYLIVAGVILIAVIGWWQRKRLIPTREVDEGGEGR